MDTDRIETALRDGPPDEPTYVPGGFRRTSRPGWWFAVAGVAVVIALVTGIAIGTALDALRGGGVGTDPGLRPLATADLQGVWESDPIEHRAWVDALLARGFSQADIDAFLEHDPFADRVRYALRFVDDVVIIQAAYDDLPFQTLGAGTIAVDDDGIRFLEVVDGVEVACQPLVAAELTGSRLNMNVLELPGCGTDERMANTLFFEIASYSRAEP